MYTLISIFYLSLLGMLAMVLLKRHEVKSGRPTVVSRLGKGTDHVFYAASSAIRSGISYFNRKTFIHVAQLIAYHVLLRTRKVYVEAKHWALSNPHGKKVIDAVRGRAEIKDHGASFYLRRISDK
jgi:hypothetical protein